MSVESLVAQPKLRWIDVVDPTPEELQTLTEEFGLDPIAVEDVVETGQRPKLEAYPNHAFLVAYAANLAEVDVFLGEDWVITVRERTDGNAVWEMKVAASRCARVAAEDQDVGVVLHAVLDEIVDGYFDMLDDFEDKIESLEDDVFNPPKGTTEADFQQRLLALRRELVAFRRKVVPLRDVLAAVMRGEVAAVNGTSLLLMQDVYDHLLRAVDTIDSHRELMGNAVEAHLAIMSNRMNAVMKLMTSGGAILLGATLVAGIYGMNFDNMPELHWRYGYAWALGIMVMVTLGGFWYFRRRDWL